RGLYDGGRAVAGASILPRGTLRIHRRIDCNYPGCSAVFTNRNRARNEVLWRELDWPGAERFFSRAGEDPTARISNPLALETKYDAGLGCVAQGFSGFGRCERTRKIY